MTITALVAGPSARADDVAAALQAQGFATVTVDHRDPVSEARSRVSPRSVDCYVQLPADAGPAGVTSEGVLSGRTQGLLSLVDGIAAVAPLLADHATIVIMAGEGSDPSRQRDRLLDDAMGVLAEAVVADHGSDGVRVSVLGAHPSPAEIAAAVRGRSRSQPAPSLADFEPGLGYADWRSEVLSLSSVNDATYFGWLGADGRRPVAVVRGAVVSPLRPVGVKAGCSVLSWGDAGPGAASLARTVLADVLGSDACCPACGGAGESGCAECGGTCLSEHAERHVGAFVREVISPLRSEGFELPAAAVQAWVDQRGGPTSGRVTRLQPSADRMAAPRRRRVRRRQRPVPKGNGYDGVPIPTRRSTPS